MEPLVSILVPAFNAGPWIAHTLESALAQTWPKKEIIVVDDGSTDETLSIARQFSSGTVCVVTQPNQGAAAARNKAFSLSQGDYVQWLDADDLLAPDKILRQMEILQRAGSQRTPISSSWGHFIYRSRKARFSPSPLWCDLSPAEWLLRKMEHDTFMQPATWLVSRRLTEAAGAWDNRLLGDDDGEYFCRVLLASEGTRFVPEARTYYRMTGCSSLSYVGRSTRALEAQFLSCELHVRYLQSLDDSARSRAACLKYLQKYYFYFHETPELVKKTEQLAESLGGRLKAPHFGWKYSWIAKLLGWTSARRAQLRYNQLKWSFIRRLDKTLNDLENPYG